VHFSVGFGPVGLVALATGRGSLASLAWSAPVGVFTLVVGRVLRRIQRSELDSQLRDEDLIMERGTVIVSIKNGQLGKVRIRLEETYAERFARARDPQENFPVGSRVRIVDIADDCVYVEQD
jgi:membrane protein implicated in regulation of membrane protease activity